MLKKSANTNLFSCLYFFVKKIVAVCAILFVFNAAHAQQTDEFKAKLAERAQKIVNTLQLTDKHVQDNVVILLAGQYYNLNQVHDAYKASVTSIKEKNLVKEETDKLIAEQATLKNESLKKLHADFLKELSVTIPEEKVEQVKNGMTYNVMNVTYAAYQKMILSLTDSQKQKIYDWLKEARELAMDEGSSDDKHKVFGKYKGKINNYLSAQGYDVKKEGEEWAKREAEAKKAQQPQN